jgi:hypothetical protein
VDGEQPGQVDVVEIGRSLDGARDLRFAPTAVNVAGEMGLPLGQAGDEEVDAGRGIIGGGRGWIVRWLGGAGDLTSTSWPHGVQCPHDTIPLRFQQSGRALRLLLAGQEVFSMAKSSSLVSAQNH